MAMRRGGAAPSAGMPLSREARHAAFFVIAVLGVVFVAEVLVMLLLDRLPPLTPLAEAILDATVLLVFVAPFVTYVIVRRSHAERHERQLEERFRAVATSATDAIIVADSDGRIIMWNPAAQKIFQYGAREVLGKPLTVLMPERYRAAHESAMARVDATGESPLSGQTLELEGRRKDGSEFPLEVSLGTWMDGERRLFSGIVRDVTERRSLELQLRRSQKLEAVGQLTGGIAHELNNLLTVILASSDLVAASIANGGPPAVGDLEELRAAAKRSAGLIRKLMAFSRQERLSVGAIDLSRVVRETVRMLRPLLPQSITIQIDITGDDTVVRGDQQAVAQILTNLVTNARDAMPHGGPVRITVGHKTLSQKLRGSDGTEDPEGYVALTVSDDGPGMEEATLERVFEPFFTTKTAGSGTGLGMAVVYGLVRQQDGFIELESELGKGTVVTVFLPRAEAGEAPLAPEQAPAAARAQDGGTVLVVEDEAQLLSVARRILERSGYRVLTAADGREAIEVFNAHRDEIDLVVLDVVMPHLDGVSVYHAIRAVRPEVRYLFTSGYTERDGPAAGVGLDPELPFLRKPWTVEEFAAKVEEILGPSHSRSKTS